MSRWSWCGPWAAAPQNTTTRTPSEPGSLRIIGKCSVPALLADLDATGELLCEDTHLHFRATDLGSDTGRDADADVVVTEDITVDEVGDHNVDQATSDDDRRALGLCGSRYGECAGHGERCGNLL